MGGGTSTDVARTISTTMLAKAGALPPMERASRSFVKQVSGCSFLCDVNARNPLFPKIRKFVLSSVCLLPPVLVIGPRVAHITAISPSFWPLSGRKLGQPGAIFCATSTRFWHFLRNLAFKFAFLWSFAPWLPRSIFVRSHRYITEFAYGFELRAGALRGHFGALLGLFRGQLDTISGQGG